MMALVHALYHLAILVLLYETVDALRCYQCNSTLDHNCQEFFNHDNPNNPLSATDCVMYQANYCIKVTGLWMGIVGTHRFCSSRDLGDQCQDMKFPDHSRKYRGCIYTCTADGCNGSSSLFSKSMIAVTTLSLLLSLFLHWWNMQDSDIVL